MFDGVVVVHDRRTDDRRRVARQDVARLEQRHAHVRGDSHFLGEEERQVSRERGLHAVGPLIQKDAVAAAEHRAVVVERQREAGARRQAHAARPQQPAIPPGFRGGHVRQRHQAQQRASLVADRSSIVARDDEPASRDIDQPVVHLAHVLVVLVAKARVDGQVRPHTPVVLCEQMHPVGPRILAAAPDARHGARRIPEQEIGERVAGELSRIRECAARVVRLLGVEAQVEQIPAELDVMRAAINQQVLVQLEMLVATIDERRRVAHRAVETRGRHLREPGVARIARDALQADLPREIGAAIDAHLPARDAQPPRAQLVHHLRVEDVAVADAEIPGAGAHIAAESWHERLLQAARAERLPIAGVERAEAGEELPPNAETLIDSNADLVDVVELRLGRGEILRLAGPVRQRHVLEEGGRNRIELALRDPK